MPELLPDELLRLELFDDRFADCGEWLRLGLLLGEFNLFSFVWLVLGEMSSVSTTVLRFVLLLLLLLDVKVVLAVDANDSKWLLDICIKSLSLARVVKDWFILESKAGVSTNRMSSSLPVVNRTIAFKHEYSAESTWSALSFSTCSWNILMWSMKATTRSAAIGEAWRPAAANSGATWSGIEHCDAFSTNNSDQTRRRSATWSVTCRSGKKGILRAHSTAENNRRAASSQMLSMPMILLVCMHVCP